MKTYKLIIEKNKDRFYQSGYWGRIENLESVQSYGQTIEDLEFSMRESVSLHYRTIEEQIPKFDFELVMDLQEFLKVNNHLNFTTIADQVGMNSSLLRQYADGIAFPDLKQAIRIKNTIKQIKIEELEELIHTTFEGVQLGEGVSWHQAVVIDDSGSVRAQNLARAQDEHDDWSKVSLELIEVWRSYQSSMIFLDARGLKFYLPICMLYVLAKNKVSEWFVTHSLINILTYASRVEELKKELNEGQELCVVKFLNLCVELDEVVHSTEEIPDALENIW